VGLRSSGPPVPATLVKHLSNTGRDDYIAVSASGGAGISVVLHIIGGLIHELEILTGKGVQIAAPPAAGMTGLRMG